MKLLKGKKLAATLFATIKREIKGLPVKPGLGAILVGDDPSSHLYVALKQKTAAALGVVFKKEVLNTSASPDEVIAAIEAFNADRSIHGILLQLPLPLHLETATIIEHIDPAKDVDGFLPGSQVVSPTVRSIISLLQHAGVSLEGKTAALLVNSDAFYQGLQDELARVGVMLNEDTLRSDIVIIAKGQPNFLRAAMIKKGAIVIDVGINVVEGKTVGDVARDVCKKASVLTPVPGSVGPLTVAYLFSNLVALTKRSLEGT